MYSHQIAIKNQQSICPADLAILALSIYYFRSNHPDMCKNDLYQYDTLPEHQKEVCPTSDP